MDPEPPYVPEDRRGTLDRRASLPGPLRRAPARLRRDQGRGRRLRRPRHRAPRSTASTRIRPSASSRSATSSRTSSTASRDEPRQARRARAGARRTAASSGFDAYEHVIAVGRRRRDPRGAARLPAGAPPGRGRSRQARLLREARRDRPDGRALGHRVRGDREEEGPHARRRHAAPPPGVLPRGVQAHPGRRDRRARLGRGLLDAGRPLARRPQARVLRRRVADPELALLHLARGRHDRRAARPPDRRRRVGLRRAAR